MYAQTKEPAFAARAWAGVNGGPNARQSYNTVALKGPDVLAPIDEVTGLSTNSTAQNCLTAIEVLAMCGDRMP